jgi:DedD protein
MDSQQDTEITLGTAKLLGLFFGLVIVCAVFFALGYTLGRKSDVGFTTAVNAGPTLQTSPNASKPTVAPQPQAQPMTFYKAVEQQSANAQLTPASDSVASTINAPEGQSTSPATTATTASTNTSSPAAPQPSPSQNAPPDPLNPPPTGGYFVQIAAVSKQEDAQALVDALKQKQYPAFVANSSPNDKLFRVQLGPFDDIKEAENMRTRLINDGYNPILKK